MVHTRARGHTSPVSTRGHTQYADKRNSATRPPEHRPRKTPPRPRTPQSESALDIQFISRIMIVDHPPPPDDLGPSGPSRGRPSVAREQAPRTAGRSLSALVALARSRPLTPAASRAVVCRGGCPVGGLTKRNATPRKQKRCTAVVGRRSCDACIPRGDEIQLRASYGPQTAAANPFSPQKTVKPNKNR